MYIHTCTHSYTHTLMCIHMQIDLKSGHPSVHHCPSCPVICILPGESVLLKDTAQGGEAASRQHLAGMGGDIKDSLCPGWGPPEYLLMSRVELTELVPVGSLLRLESDHLCRCSQNMELHGHLSMFLQRLREMSDRQPLSPMRSKGNYCWDHSSRWQKWKHGFPLMSLN